MEAGHIGFRALRHLRECKEDGDIVAEARGDGDETEEAERRRQIALESNDRGTRGDDENEEALRLRIAEFNEKTLPVLKTYEDLGILIKIESDDSKDVVFERVINALIERTE